MHDCENTPCCRRLGGSIYWVSPYKADIVRIMTMRRKLIYKDEDDDDDDLRKSYQSLWWWGGLTIECHLYKAAIPEDDEWGKKLSLYLRNNWNIFIISKCLQIDFRSRKMFEIFQDWSNIKLLQLNLNHLLIKWWRRRAG